MAEAGKQKIIVGLGLTGLSCARFLTARNEPFTVVDDRESPPGLEALKKFCPEARIELGPFSDDTFAGADTLIVSPGVDLRTAPIRKSIASGVRVTGDVDIFARQITAPIVAVTGSNAKSTVVTLVGEMLKAAGINAAVAGNIGKPVLDVLSEGEHDLYVLELSSFQLETTKDLGARVATVLNMSADHLDRYTSMQDYHRAKHRIFQGCRQIVVNRDDALSSPLAASNLPRLSFGLSVPDIGQFGLKMYQGEEFLAFGNERLMKSASLKTAGRHNLSNALAALAIGHAINLSFDTMVETLLGFEGLPHRCQWVAEIDGVNYYNDSKGTNVGACIAALEGLSGKGRVILLAGGVGKGADFSPLGDPLQQYAKLAILFGQDAHLIATAVRGKVDILEAGNLSTAVTVAKTHARPGDIVLMSPACASFDMFRNYEQRGNEYMQCVRELH